MMTRADVECFAELLMRTQRWEPKDEKGGIFLEFTTEGDSYEQKQCTIWFLNQLVLYGKLHLLWNEPKSHFRQFLSSFSVS